MRPLAVCVRLDMRVPVLQGRADALLALKVLMALLRRATATRARHAPKDTALPRSGVRQVPVLPRVMCVQLASPAQACLA